VSRLLLINPNTTAAVTEQLRGRAQAVAPGGGELHAVTATFGAAYIADEPAVVLAGHAALDAYAAHVATHGVPGAVLIGCFGDPGLEALRAVASAPVHGLAEASMAEAARVGRFSIVTGGARWPAMLRRLVHTLGLEAALAGIVAIDRTGGQLAADPEGAVRDLRQACEQSLQAHRPQAIVLGGAALTPFAAAVAAGLPVPLFDSVEVAVRVAWQAAMRDAATASPLQPVVLSGDPPGVWAGLSPQLLSLLSRVSPVGPG
jgi:Asp/Glu/hydantoin racemase